MPWDCFAPTTSTAWPGRVVPLTDGGLVGAALRNGEVLEVRWSGKSWGLFSALDFCCNTEKSLRSCLSLGKSGYKPAAKVYF